VLRGEPNWSALRPSVPAPIRTLLTLCLAKDRQQRMTDIAVGLAIWLPRVALRLKARIRDENAKSILVAQKGHVELFADASQMASTRL
jgi:hypothetical protein